LLISALIGLALPVVWLKRARNSPDLAADDLSFDKDSNAHNFQEKSFGDGSLWPQSTNPEQGFASQEPTQSEFSTKASKAAPNFSTSGSPDFVATPQGDAIPDRPQGANPEQGSASQGSTQNFSATTSRQPFAKCAHCLQTIPLDANICPFCSAVTDSRSSSLIDHLPGRLERGA
jgi:hypothetical protein